VYSEQIIETLRAMDRVRIVNPLPGGAICTSGKLAASLFASGRADITEEFALLFRKSPTT
jgi:hypothetical protein